MCRQDGPDDCHGSVECRTLGRQADCNRMIRRVLARKENPQRQRPGPRRQHYIGPIQKPARPPGNVDNARRPLGRPITEEKELALPDYWREITGCEIGDERTDRPVNYPLFLNSEPVPLHSHAASLEGQTCPRQIVDDLDYISIANVESQMVRDCSRGDHGIAAVTVSKQGERSGRRNIARDPSAAACQQLRRGGHVVRLFLSRFCESRPWLFDHNEEGSTGFDESRAKATAGLPRSHYAP